MVNLPIQRCEKATWSDSGHWGYVIPSYALCANLSIIRRIEVSTIMSQNRTNGKSLYSALKSTAKLQLLFDFTKWVLVKNANFSRTACFVWAADRDFGRLFASLVKSL